MADDDDDDEIDYAELIDGFSLEEAIICCSDVGIDASSGDFGLDVVKAALRNRYCPTDLTPAEVFAEIDSEAKGVLTVPQVQHAAALLGGMLLAAAGLQATVEKMDQDGDGGVSVSEFESWWEAQEAETEQALEQEWGATKIEAVWRGCAARRAVKAEHGFEFTGSLELAEIAEGATALMYDLDDDSGPSDWVTLDEAMDLIMDGTLTDATSVWTEGASGRAPAAPPRPAGGLPARADPR